MTTNEKKYFAIVISISVLAMIFLIWLIYFKPEINPSFDVSFLPWMNAFFNSLSAFFLVMGLKSIKAKKIERHKKNMLLAFIASTLFLISYIIYHTYHGDQKFMGEGFIRPIYFFILITHIGLSIVTLPMVLLTFTLAYLKSWDKHKKLAKWSAPLWLYVSVTGVLIVIFLKTFN